ncbi:hypothetical protein TRFO_42751 [Tritrichomonas foetus]|uniref:Leucine-rich repeat domain-containing protein n=1 Tax=Tritrichomonas foetus TaxID=1144522 RepID=A0A1J4KZ86_9EUKA|nr:hypothetical protein TRFO_42751 [Tritrichomonas foetus]|eukprot:OHT15004.1 hypothetical protein TRFO_42751 [Tritrichomonas foetus]
MSKHPSVIFPAEIRRNSMPDKFAMLQEKAEIDGINYQLDSFTARIFRSNISSGEVTIPSSIVHNGKSYIVTKLSNHAFERSTIHSLRFASDSEVTSFGTACLPDTLERLQISARLRELEYCFLGNAKNLTKIEIDPENPYFSIVDGCLYNRDLTILYIIPRNKRILNLPQQTVRINPYAGSYSALNKINFPDDSKLKVIDNAAFASTNLTEVNFPPSVTQLGNFCFENVSLRKATTAGRMLSIGRDCFDKLSSFTLFVSEDTVVKEPSGNSPIKIVRLNADGIPMIPKEPPKLTEQKHVEIRLTEETQPKNKIDRLEDRILSLENENRLMKIKIGNVKKRMLELEKKMSILLPQKD